jgi:hypothetical protein
MAEVHRIEIPGTDVYELPPLLVRSGVETCSDLSTFMSEAEDMLPSTDADEEVIERRKFELALQLTEQYKGLVHCWTCGDSIYEWIRQCEMTFESQSILRELMHPDIWPHASRGSFVELLRQKNVPTGGVNLHRAVGLRISFRQPPQGECLSSQFLVYLSTSVADTAYANWSQPSALFPPERFHFEIVDMK